MPNSLFVRNVRVSPVVGGALAAAFMLLTVVVLALASLVGSWQAHWPLLTIFGRLLVALVGGMFGTAFLIGAGLALTYTDIES